MWDCSGKEGNEGHCHRTRRQHRGLEEEIRSDGRRRFSSFLLSFAAQIVRRRATPSQSRTTETKHEQGQLVCLFYSNCTRSTSGTRPTSSRAESPSRQRHRTPSPPPPPQPDHPAANAPEPAPNPLPPPSIIHHLPEGSLRQTIAGYVAAPTTPSSMHSISPFLVPTLACNVISLREARRLGLDVMKPLPDEDVVGFDFGAGRAECSVGQTELLWSGNLVNDGRSPPLAVVCEVCESEGVGLVLGRPFVEDRERWWIAR
ncbi:hypothetical protein C8A01DRAFT_21614 [Parachaetomium inaequale]|uniref:Uncharacterized protein n=1 Tax=Parachaetomium inaequale TaxID=2588326 RepID=A0AAN6P3L9_9PEZI|nr:hypothetical protein C8A01DRAFT_21614 [Parachaetomium inaequale]